MPAGTVHYDNAMGIGGHRGADLLKMLLHGLGIGIGHHQGRTFVVLRADRAKDIGALIALIGNLARACAFLSPLIDLRVFLAHACFILEPDFYRRLRRKLLQGLNQLL